MKNFLVATLFLEDILPEHPRFINGPIVTEIKWPLVRNATRDGNSQSEHLHLENTALDRWLAAAEQAPKSTVMWGQMAYCDSAMGFAPNLPDVVAFVRSASWYRGLPPPSWKPGGKGQFNFEEKGTGDGQWIFLLGAFASETGR